MISPRKIKQHLDVLLRPFYLKLLGKRTPPIFILGNQKSGTSAIAWLMSQASGGSLTLDITRSISSPDWQKEVKEGQYSLEVWSQFYPYEFSKTLIKEPALTLFTSELIQGYPDATYVFIVRDPRDNIRSILNRTKLSGAQQDKSTPKGSVLENAPAWRMILDSDWLTDKNSASFVESLSHRWNYCCEEYLKHKSNIILIKYEDFMKDKAGCIQELVGKVGLTNKNSIAHLVDTQKQSKGDNSASWSEFYGKENLELVNHVTDKYRKLFDYV